MSINFRYFPCGDNGVLIKLEDKISENINKEIRNLTYYINIHKFKGFVELIPAYNSILLIYSPIEASYNEIIDVLDGINEDVENIILPPPEVIEIPVLYGGEYGPDIKFVAEYNNLNIDDIVRIHSGRSYLIYMLGFTPGFPYLGGMAEEIAAPRLEIPRSRIPGGSVGVAGNQTGIYPIESPGGWRIIGRTPVKLFDINRKPEVLLGQGQYIRFKPIDINEYGIIENQIEKGTYEIKKFIKKEVT